MNYLFTTQKECVLAPDICTINNETRGTMIVFRVINK